MNKTLLSATLVAALGTLAFVPAAHAASNGAGPIFNSTPDGTLTINGQVLAQTCTVDGKAAGTSDNKVVTLPDQWKTALAASGNVAGATTFTIVIAACDPALTTVQTYFSGGTLDGATGNLKNSGTAQNVDVQLLDGQNTNAPIVLSNTTTSGSGSQTATKALASGGATLSYQAQYIATGAATAGTVIATTSFTMIYN
ncbi:fimbrial protein [Rhodanobacter sp. MP7CTX1]|jgi:major type 1 subunit fimbrin (pilin)|uniref:fimbrial protein n=1 Tax=Rhodanobacter sp. MP7CTX1 TaxID=2723084 RepID=UPI00161777BC|nr:fimbrial protein [Rhodanobacter sp. MP7CTX1]MBB6188275.1 major type 1 subunit fimbrin (pilin) [Rhodanobacter sp. MP7CTX1]